MLHGQQELHADCPGWHQDRVAGPESDARAAGAQDRAPLWRARRVHVRPEFRGDRGLRKLGDLYRRREGRAALSRLSDRAARRGLELHRGRVSLAARRAADAAAVERVRPLDPHAHDDQRVVAAVLQRFPPQRAPDGDGQRRGRVDVGVLSRQHGHPESGGPRYVRAPDHRQAADDRRGRLQALARPAVRLSAEPARLLQQPAAHVLRRAVRRVHGQSGRGRGARSPVHLARGPRAELQHVDRAARGQLGHEPLLGDRGRDVGALGARRTAARTRP